MSPENSDLLVRWTARIVVALYLWRCWLDFNSCHSAEPTQIYQRARWLWSVGALLFAVHVGSALAFIHEFSHDKAYQHTAERTAAVIGVNWCGGIYFNHAFMLYWFMDALLWWSFGADWPYRSRLYYWTMQFVFAFMFVNATLVFGPRHWVYIAILLIVAVLPVAVLKKREQFGK